MSLAENNSPKSPSASCGWSGLMLTHQLITLAIPTQIHVEIQHGHIWINQDGVISPGYLPLTQSIAENWLPPATPCIQQSGMYQYCRCNHINEAVQTTRLCFLGYVLHLAHDAPTQCLIDHYFIDSGITAFTGRWRTKLAMTLSTDLRHIGRMLRCTPTLCEHLTANSGDNLGWTSQYVDDTMRICRH